MIPQLPDPFTIHVHKVIPFRYPNTCTPYHISAAFLLLCKENGKKWETREIRKILLSLFLEMVDEVRIILQHGVGGFAKFIFTISQ